MSNTSNLKVIYTNADQLPNKIDEICIFLYENNIDIMCVCEVLPKCNYHDISSFVIQGYTCYTCLDGRGVCVFVKNDIELTIVELCEIQAVFKPSIFMRIVTSQANLVLGVIYRSPNCSTIENENMNIQIANAVKRSHAAGEDIVIVGDFNYPEINWISGACSQSQCHKSAALFLENVQLNNLTQFIHEPTHYTLLYLIKA